MPGEKVRLKPPLLLSGPANFAGVVQHSLLFVLSMAILSHEPLRRCGYVVWHFDYHDILLRSETPPQKDCRLIVQQVRHIVR